MISAKEIRSKKFRLAKGYDREEVDEFLSSVSDDYSKLSSELSELNTKYETLSKALTYYKELENALQKTMVIAQKNADDTLNTAKNNAKITMETANKTANETLDAAKQAAKATIDAANNTSKQIVFDATKQSEEIIAISNERAAKTISNANKTATTTLNEVAMKAASYEEAAKEKAIEMLTKASSDYNTIKNMTRNLIAEYENYKAQFKNLAMMQFDLINNKAFDVNLCGLKTADESFNVELDFEKMYEEYKTTHFKHEDIMNSVPLAQAEYATPVEPETIESIETETADDETTVSQPIEPETIAIQHVEPEPVVEEIIADDDFDNDNIDDIINKINDIDYNDNNIIKDNTDLDAIKDLESIDGLEETAVNPPVSLKNDDTDDDTDDDIFDESDEIIEEKIAESNDNYNILFKAQTSTKGRNAVNTFDDSQIDEELADDELADDNLEEVSDDNADIKDDDFDLDDFDENAYSALDNALNNMLDKVLADAESNSVQSSSNYDEINEFDDDLSFDDDMDIDVEDNIKPEKEKITVKEIFDDNEDEIATPVKSTSIDKNDEIQDKKENNPNIGISFNESDNASLFSPNNTNDEDDDEFIFDDTDDSDDDSIGITFDFLDK